MILNLRIACLIIFCLTFHINQIYADDLLNAGRAASLDIILENAISNSIIAGGVVEVGNSSGVLYRTSQGSFYPNSCSTTQLDEYTTFDVASLTKVIATAPSVMKLLEQGRLHLLDPLAKWFPELAGTVWEETTILSLLTHTSGISDFDLTADNALNNMIKNITQQNISVSLGINRFRYADINFILLGELVKRVSGERLDIFCESNIFNRLGFKSTSFLPRTDFQIIAPTLGLNNIFTTGIVQDINARKLGGVAGHAGLFSTAAELGEFARMILNKGENRGARIFSSNVIDQMTAPYFYHDGKIVRGLGWDIQSPYSSPRGNGFSDMSFGHTGYSGTSIWLDPQQDLYVILLTIRLDYKNVRAFNKLRRNISNIAVSIFATPDIGKLLIDDIKTP